MNVDVEALRNIKGAQRKQKQPNTSSNKIGIRLPHKLVNITVHASRESKELDSVRKLDSVLFTLWCKEKGGSTCYFEFHAKCDNQVNRFL